MSRPPSSVRLPEFAFRELVYPGLLVVVILVCLSASLLLSRQSVGGVALGDYGSYRCATGRDDGDLFRILTLTSEQAIEFADGLCRAPVVAERFSGVEILWRSRQFLESQHIVEEQFDYFWSRDHLVSGLVPNIEDYYLQLLETSHYSLYWVARVPGLALTAEYFAGKRVGLVKDNHSQSYYLQPMRALKDAGIELADDQKIYFDHVGALYGALREGRIDLATGAVNTPRTLGMPELEVLLLADDVPSGFWYLRKRYRHRVWHESAHCPQCVRQRQWQLRPQ